MSFKTTHLTANKETSVESFFLRTSRATIAVGAALFLAAGGAVCADLTIQSRTDAVYDGGQFNRLVIQSSSNITIRNATFTSGLLSAVVDINNSNNIILEDCTISGQGTACTGINVGGTCVSITFSRNTIRDIADDGIQVRNTRDLKILNNRVFSLLGIGTDSGGTCNNGHSDAIELGTVTDCEIIGNLVFDIRSTSAIFFGNWSATSAGYCRNVLIANNVFCAPESGFLVYLSQADGVQLYHNAIWWGRYGGVAIAAGLTNLDMENNILHSINYQHHGVPYDASNHRIRRNLLGTTSGQGTPTALLSGDLNNFVAVDPRFNGLPSITNTGSLSQFRTSLGSPPALSIEAFQLRSDSPAVNAGRLVEMVPFDIRGAARPSPDLVDLGAFEMESASVPARPDNLNATTP
ncbi:MAG: right-handed parallel beta-helix repeat-containing protein [Opitutaceae bacterium]|nr:right-handed parallel beta-helix repeat-containing protein [Opitutaceae bacterium]